MRVHPSLSIAVVSLVLAGLTSASPLAAQVPIVSINPAPPGQGSYYQVSEQVAVTVTYCSPTGGGQFDGWPTLYFNGGGTGFSYSSGSQSGCDDYGTISGTVTVANAGDNWLTTGVTNLSGYSPAQYNLLVYVQPPPPVVTAGGSAVVPAASGIRGSFRITAGGTGWHSISASCTNVATGCTVAPTGINLAAGATTDVVVTYSTVGGAPLDTGRVTLTVTNDVSAQASFFVRVAPTGPAIARDLCLRVGAGQAASSECGDLRIVHALPAFQTMGRVRAPILTYSSQNAVPWPIKHSMVTFTNGQARPDSVRATLRMGGISASRNWPGSQWPAGTTTRRVGVPLRADTLATGIYADTLEIGYVTGCPSACSYAAQTVTAGSSIIVNRSASTFGNGWWLAGYEQLMFPADSSLLWIGGDGSARRYVHAGGNVYLAAPVDAPDSLRRNPADTGSKYVRLLPGGDSVVFNAAGLHVRTVNAQGHRTNFLTDGSGRLSQIQIPPNGSGLAYTFTYGTDNRLATVVAPDSARTTTFTRNAGRITYIQDPGFTTSQRVQFGYTPTVPNRLNSRYDRMGRRTWLLYSGQSSRMTSAKMAIGSGDTILTTFRWADTRGAAGPDSVATHPDSLFTLIDGPRTDVSDTTRFWHDAFGGVAMVRDPLGNVTTVTRGDPRWPALPTRTVAANGRVALAAYDARGNPASVTDSSVVIGGQFATTRYEWHPLTSALTATVPPERDSVVIAYDGAGRNRQWQDDASGSPSRVSFTYNTANQVVSVLSPLSSLRDSIIYDARGNVIRTRSPLGFQTLFDRDNLGRVTRVRTPVDSAQTSWREEWTYYDAAGRDSVHETRGGSDTVRVRNFYNLEGQLDSVRRWTAPDPASIGTITTRWSYDAVGRAYRETAPDDAYDTRTFDYAGNVIRLVTRRGDTLHMEYDALNRLTRRIVPAVVHDSIGLGIAASNLSGWRLPYPWFPTDTVTRQLLIPGDTATFTYDAMGNMVTARNAASRIFRQYFADGLLKRDSIILLPYVGQDSSLHRYVIARDYDLNRRVRVVRHPVQLAPSGTAGRDTVRYVYNGRGLLSNVYDLQGNQFDFTYDARGRRTAMAFPGSGITQTWTYDADDRLLTEAIANTRYDTIPAANRHHFPVQSLRQRGFRYQDPGRVWIAANSAGWMDTSTATYSALGQLARLIYRRPAQSGWWGSGTQVSDEQLTNDPLGNTTVTVTSSSVYFADAHQTTTSPRYQRYYPGTGRLRATEQILGSGTRLDSLLYDEAGNLTVSYTTPGYGGTTQREDRVTFYGADGLARVAESRTQIGNATETGWTMAFEEYRYDALGRRVLVHTRRHCALGYNEGCALGIMRRTVWDGDQELWEIQAPEGGGTYSEYDTTRVPIAPYQAQKLAGWDPNRHYGRVGYTHAIGVDQPLSLTRLAYTDWAWSYAINDYLKVDWAPFTIVPLWNWRGHPEISVFADSGANNDGNWRYCTGTSSPVRCVPMRWRPTGTAQSAGVSNSGVWYALGWQGTLLEQKEDAVGTFYRRNRYLDPSTGRFTQEDPIGMAGGINLYGYADGDPVTFADPFGLAPQGIVLTGAAAQAFYMELRAQQKAGNECPPCENQNSGSPTTDSSERTGLQRAGDLAAGFGDFITLGGTRKIREMIGCGDCVDYGSGTYATGQVAGGVASVAGGGLAVARGLGWTSRIAVHSAHHGFPMLGRLAHVQVNVWRLGVKGSGGAVRIPLPWR